MKRGYRQAGAAGVFVVFTCGFLACGIEPAPICGGVECLNPDARTDSSDCDGTKSPRETPCLLSERYSIFVSPKGDDVLGDGSREKPFGTVTKALSAIRAERTHLILCSSE